VYALSGELRNEFHLKRKEPLLILAIVNGRIVSGYLRNRTIKEECPRRDTRPVSAFA
jgi:hypothetical protein